MNIKTQCVCPPIPTRKFDWLAYDDDTYDGAPDSGTRNQVGHGATEQEAITNLMEQLSGMERAMDAKPPQTFLKVWMREKWGIEPGLLSFPEMELKLSIAQLLEAMESYKDYCLKVTAFNGCAFCGNSPAECECPQPL